MGRVSTTTTRRRKEVWHGSTTAAATLYSNASRRPMERTDGIILGWFRYDRGDAGICLAFVVVVVVVLG